MMRYNALGQELPDDTPLEVPSGMRRPLTLQEQIQNAVRGALSAAAARQESETFDEANDFEVEDEEWEDMITAHEFRDMTVEIPKDAEETFTKFRESRKPKAALGNDRGDVGEEGKVQSSEMESDAAS